jgi:signal transduction histidine kinase
MEQTPERGLPLARRIVVLPRYARTVLGGVIGLAAALLSAVLAAAFGEERLFISNLPLLAVSVVGLLLGWVAAAVGFILALGALIGLAAVGGIPSPQAGDLLRLISFALATPVIIFLLRSSERLRASAIAARDSARLAHREADSERASLELARQELSLALATAERERARLEEVAEAIPEPLIVYDDGLQGTYGNRAAMRLFGRSFVERPLDEWGRTTEPRDEHGFALERDEWPQVLAQSEALRRRLILRIPMSGRDVMVDVEGTPIPGGGAVLLLRDVGKEEDERRRLSRFASFVAHELRNPLAVAKARTELAQRDPNLPKRAASHGARALESVDAAIGILERLELYSRADSGNVEATREPFDLAPALGKAIERLRTRGSEREIVVSLAPRVGVVGDRPLSEQAITNLLTNADRYSTPGAPIHVEVEAAEMVKLRVIDEGPGIPDEIAERLFLDRVAVGRGLGLGLFLVRASMDAMGGSVHLERRRPGAVFTLRWPAAPVRDG